MPAVCRFPYARDMPALVASEHARAGRRGRALHGGSHPRRSPPRSDRRRHRRRRRHRSGAAERQRLRPRRPRPRHPRALRRRDRQAHRRLRTAACRSSCSPRPTGSTTRPRGSSSAPTTTSPSPSSSGSSCSASEHSTAGARTTGRPCREIAGLRLDPFRREVFRDGRYVALTRKQFAVLEVLVAAEGGVVSAEELLERAWDENADPFTNAVRITVSALRKRLGEPWLIATVPGVGYRIDTGGATVPRPPGLSVRLKLTLSYAGFLMLASALLLAVVWVFAPAVHARRRHLRPAVLAAEPLRPPERLRAAGGRRAGVPAGVRPRGRVAPRRPHARAPDPHHRRHPHGRDRVALPPHPAGGPQRRVPRARRRLRRHARAARGARRRAAAVRRQRLPRAAHPAGDHPDAPRRGPQGSEPRQRRARRPPPRSSTRRAIDLTEALLLLSRADQRSFVREHVDLSLIAEEATETLLPLAEERGATSRPPATRPPPSAPPPSCCRWRRTSSTTRSSTTCPTAAPCGSRPRPSRERGAHRREHRRAAHGATRRHARRAVPARHEPHAHRPRGRRPRPGASSRASPRRTTGPSPSPRGPAAGSASRCDSPPRRCPARSRRGWLASPRKASRS